MLPDVSRCLPDAPQKLSEASRCFQMLPRCLTNKWGQNDDEDDDNDDNDEADDGDGGDDADDD